MERCASCGVEVAESAHVCAGCGAALPLTLAPEPGDEHQIPFPPDDCDLPVAGGPAGTPGAEPAAGPSGLSPRELLTAAAAVMAAGVLTFLLLVTRGAEETSAASAPDPGESTAASGPAGATPPAFRNAWSTENVGRWVANGRTFAIELPAENRVSVWQRTVTPVLVVRCRARGAEVFVVTESPARIEPKTDRHTVHLAFDGEPATTEQWPDSADHDALFAPDGAALLARLAGAQTFAFGFTPHNAGPVLAHFNVAGLAPHLQGTRECGWVPGR